MQPADDTSKPRSAESTIHTRLAEVRDIAKCEFADDDLVSAVFYGAPYMGVTLPADRVETLLQTRPEKNAQYALLNVAGALLTLAKPSNEKERKQVMEAKGMLAGLL